MKYALHLTAQDWTSFRRRASRADDGGFSHLWIAETPFFAYDPYIALAEAARATRSCMLGPGCTNVVLRHEILAASALASIDALAPGRVVCGLGSGDRAVRLLGKKPTRIDDMRLAVDRMRRFWRGEDVDYDGSHVRLSWPANELPVYLFAEGARSLALGGETADAVVVGSGIDPGIVEWSAGCIDRGVSESGRSERPDVWYACLASIAQDKQRAMDAIRPRLANRVRHNFMAAPELVPPEHKADFERLLAAFNLSEWHQQNQAGLVTDYMVERFALAGTVGDIVAQSRELERLGVTGLLLNFPVGDFDERLETFVTEVMPAAAA
ncbi:MAG: LLM class flavin-dependent oxidoreductase [Chloroflexota bacterium]